MQVIIWWDWDNNHDKPWMYELQYLDSTMSGCCKSLRDVYREVELFMVPMPAVQDNQPQYVQ